MPTKTASSADEPEDNFKIVDKRGMPMSSTGSVSSSFLPNADAAKFESLKSGMHFNRLKKTSAVSSGMGTNGGSLDMAMSRPRDPMWYWRENNIPFDFTEPDQLKKIRDFCRLLYITHPIIAACVDIFSKMPLQGMHFECKDDQLTDFYNGLFIDQLHYDQHLVKLGRQYWILGEIFSMGSWNENLGIWDDEQLIHPDNIDIEASLFVKDNRYLMRLPESLRNILVQRTPHYDYQQLVSNYPELLQYVNEDQKMPISNYILHHMKFDSDDFSERGVSILMRCFRSIIQEEMLNAAQDAISERLYTPLIIAKLGASASDLGTDSPWVPTEDEKMNFNSALNSALMADFRIMTTHFATDIEQVFGRENMPDFTNDFDRLEDRILMSFGLSKTMLTGASAGETYAADALNRDVVTQLLTHFQKKLQAFVYERAAIVAEAQEHYDYEVRNGQRYLITEEIWEIDEETGEDRLVEKPKLLVPELKFDILNLSDKETERQFLMGLSQTPDVPVPVRTLLQAADLDYDEVIEQVSQERVDLAVAEQQTRQDIYKTLKRKGLPIDPALRKDFDPKAIVQGGDPTMEPGSDTAIPGLGAQQGYPVLNPTADDDDSDQEIQQDQMDQEAVNDETAPEPPDLPQTGDDVPPESSEQMDRMPKAGSTKPIPRLGIRKVTSQYFEAPDNTEEPNPTNWQPTGKFGKPKHIGMTKYLDIPEKYKYKPQD